MIPSRARVWTAAGALVVLLACAAAVLRPEPAIAPSTGASVFDLEAPEPTSDPLEATRRVQKARHGAPEAP